MNELLAKRIMRKLETLPDERVYQVLDYIEFLESRYAERSAPGATPFQRLAETVEDTLRAGRVGVGVVRGTMDAMSAAGRVMTGLAAAGKAVVDQVADSVTPPPSRPRLEPGDQRPKPEAGVPPAAPSPPDAEGRSESA